MQWASPHSPVEAFHLVFLASFALRVDRQLWILKGGANLRYFFRSPRYSEDIDLDVQTIATGTLRKNVDQVLASAPVTQRLASIGVGIRAVNAGAKQTDTTQRWKVTLGIEGRSSPLPTKIEFSRREAAPLEHTFERVDPVLCSAYGIGPLGVTHYTRAAAAAQKVAALAGRAEVQARDVFDLGLLTEVGVVPAPGVVSVRVRDAAAARVLDLDYAAFTSQVLAYLADDDRSLWKGPAAWEALQLRVLAWLEALDVRP